MNRAQDTGHRTAVRGGVFLVSLGFALLVTEIGFRVLAHSRNLRAYAEAENEQLPAPGTVVSLGDIVRPIADDRIVYELRAGLKDVKFEGAMLRTNQLGFRGSEIEEEKHNDTIRIVGIGDSVMFGWGVEEPQTFLALLEQKLNEQFPERSWEVINTAVPGYNTVIEVATLATKALQLEPDLVLIGFVGNDLDLPNFLSSEEDVYNLEVSFLERFVRDRLETTEKTPTSGLVHAPHREGAEVVFENDELKVPERYRHLVGQMPAFNAVESLAALAARDGFEVSTIAYWRDPAIAELPKYIVEAFQIAQSFGFHIVDQRNQLASFTAKQGIETYDHKQFVLSETDAHPSPLHHQLLADSILETWGDIGLIARLMQ